jgi:hypothetical protein
MNNFDDTNDKRESSNKLRADVKGSRIIWHIDLRGRGNCISRDLGVALTCP